MKRNTIPPLLVAAFLVMRSVTVGGEAPDTTKTKPGETVEKGIVILVQFTDVKNDVNRAAVQTRFSQHLNAYIKEMSYGKVSLDVDVTKGWYTMPDPIGKYKISPRNLEVDRSRVKKVIEDAINAADAEVDFTKYSFSVVLLGAQVTDYGMIGLCGYPGMLGWAADSGLKTKKGQAIKGGAAIFCYHAHLGTLFHDVAHVLGGVKDGKRMVPCLYDHDLQAKPGPQREVFLDSTINMGFWDPMSCHFYKKEIPPPGISSWTRLRLNWLDPAKVKVVKPGERAEFILGPLNDAASEVLACKIPITEKTCYLIENRQPVGFDKNLPGSGVLIMYADDGVPECRHGKAPVKLVDADPTGPHLEKAAFDIGKKDSFKDPKNKFQVQLVEKVKGAYRILVSPL